MKNLKKLISVIIAVIMIVGSFATVSAADYADVESTNSYYKAIQVLSGLGIAKGDEAGNFNPTADVKRSEMVTFICRAMGEEDIAVGAAGANFTDVAANHWAAGYIAWGVNRGIINGMGDGTFAPDAPVKYQDAVVMIMRALGYDGIANRAINGGYPTGYLKVASQWGVLNKAGYDSTKAATREIIAQLINNALTAPIVEVSEYGSAVDGDTYKICEADKDGKGLKCLLSTTNKVYRVKAKVVNTALTDIDLITEEGNKVELEIEKGLDYTAAELKAGLDNLITMGTQPGDIVYAGESGIDTMANEVVEAYLAYDEDLNSIVVLAAVASNATDKIEVANVIDLDLVNGKYILKYKVNADDLNRNAKELVVAGTATLYVNGNTSNKTVSANTSDIKTILADAASVTLTKDRGTSVYSAIYATSYSAYAVVDEVQATKDRIITLDGDAIKLNYEERTAPGNDERFSYNIYDANGAAISLADIKEGDVLNILVPGSAYGVAASDINKATALTIYVTSNVIEGSVDENLKESTTNTDKYLINGEEYKVLKNGKGIKNNADFKAGFAGKFFVTIDGMICAADGSSEISRNFALVSYAGYTNKGSSSNAVYKVDLITADGEVATYELAKKVTVNGAQNKSDAVDAIKVLEGYTTKKNAYERFITYKLDADGKIKAFALASAKNNAAVSSKYDASRARFDSLNAADKVVFVVEEDVLENNAKKVYYAEGKSVYYKENDATVDTYSLKADYVKVISTADLADEQSYDFRLYQLGSDANDKTFSVALSVKKLADSYASAGLAVVLKKADIYLEDEAVKYTLVQNGETIELIMSEDCTVTGAANVADQYDVIQYSVNAAGEISGIQVVANYNTANKGFKLDATLKAYDEETKGYGFVEGWVTDKAADTLYLADNVTPDGNDKITAVTGEKAYDLATGNYTYAKIDIRSIIDGDDEVVTAIDFFDIEAANYSKELAWALCKVDKDGDIQDIVILVEAKDGVKFQ